MLSKYIWKLKMKRKTSVIQLGILKKEEENQRKKLQFLDAGKTGNPRP